MFRSDNLPHGSHGLHGFGNSFSCLADAHAYVPETQGACFGNPGDHANHASHPAEGQPCE